MKNIAVILCGSGFKDGSEIRESVGVLWALSAAGVRAQCFSPDGDQADVINCLTGEPTRDKRNMRVEAARIARGEVRALTEFRVAEFDALIIPGGFGAAKNLCNFALQGSKGVVCSELQSALWALAKAGKPIGAVCIAPAILALTFRDKQLELTVGPLSETAQEIEKLGHKHVVCRANECHVDEKHKVVTTPAYMIDDAPLHEIFLGIEKLVRAVVALSTRTPGPPE